MNTNIDTICPICGKYYFEEYDSFDYCPICGWGDDSLQREKPDYKGGFNKMSVNEAKEAYRKGEKII